MEPHFKTRATLPASLEILAHCRRTAAVAKLIAHHLFLPTDEKTLLEAACLLHHNALGLLTPESMERLLADVLGKKGLPDIAGDTVPWVVREVLNAYDAPGSGSPLAAKLAGILCLSEAFDQSMEAQPLGGEDIDEIFHRLRDGVEGGLWPEHVMNALVEATLPQPIGDPESWRAPVFPQAALQMLRLMRDPQASVAQILRAASLDPATAGLVMQLANSALFGSRARISTLAAAITRLGVATAQKVLLSSALRPVFASRKLQSAWPHSLRVADLAAQLATQAGGIDPAEAYLAGLLHDVGRIALLAVPLYDSARLEGLERDGCPPVYAETLLLHTDHAALGARMAAAWRLPNHMTHAIRQHHQPEMDRSPLASSLYLAEFISGSDEDLPSLIRLETSLKGLGLAHTDLERYQVSPLAGWLAAA